MKNFKQLLIKKNDTIRNSIKIINESNTKIAFVICEDNILVGTITDGDIRRGILSGFSLEDKCTKIMRRNFRSVNLDTKFNATNIIEIEKLNQIPVLDNEGKIIELIIKDNIFENNSIESTVVIMAGGEGKRLGKLTEEIPKPLLEIAGKPMIDIVMENCIEAGFRNFFVSVNYLKHKIISHLSSRKRSNISIKYLEENFPMGTGGSLSLLPSDIKKPILVLNADVLTKVNLNKLLEFHNENNSILTICSREVETIVPYGVITSNGYNVTQLKEKPIYKNNVNAGIYVINPELISLLPSKKYFDMTDIVTMALSQNKEVKIFPIHEYWLDVGIPETFKRAHGEWL